MAKFGRLTRKYTHVYLPTAWASDCRRRAGRKPFSSEHDHAQHKPRARALFRIWVVRYGRWRPGVWSDLPPRSLAVAPAESSPLPVEEALPFLEGFNRTMLTRRDRLWAVAVPVTILYQGDLRVGQRVSAVTDKLFRPAARLDSAASRSGFPA